MIARTPAERVGMLRTRLEELRNHGVGSNTTLDILIELTEIVAATCQTTAQRPASSLRRKTTALKAGRNPESSPARDDLNEV